MREDDMRNGRAVAFGWFIVVGIIVATIQGSFAQDKFPMDRNPEGFAEYHRAPAYRESESHPLRILAYIVHPIGWLAREVIFRPFSYFASSTPETRAVLGYRDPYDYRDPSCFAADSSIPDCREVAPFSTSGGRDSKAVARQVVYFPDVNFDFNKRALNANGVRKANIVAKMLKEGEPLSIELQGHADNRGGDAYNMKLGMDRAQAVRDELVKRGVAAESLYTVSFGERRPLFEEDEEWAYAANRRVEVHLTKGE
jgi:outer membrane protein OmpA-like peptidoglycan-associated protein